MRLVLDFETANTEQPDLLKKGGVQAYAVHPATEVLCLCWRCTPRGIKGHWLPGQDTDELFLLCMDKSFEFEAHNAAFEQMIWKHIMERRYDMPPIPIKRWRDSMAKAYQAGLPGALDSGAKMLHLPVLKDKVASKMTIALSHPITKKDWNTDVSEGGWRPDDWAGTKKAWDKSYKPIFDRRPQTLQAVVEYCHTDCEVEELLSEALPDLSPSERQVWELDQLINWRGVAIDRALCQQVDHLVHNALEKGTKRFLELTGGVLVASPNLIPWVESQGVEVPTKVCTSGKKKGQLVKTLDKLAVDKLLGGTLEVLEGGPTADEEGGGNEDDEEDDAEVVVRPVQLPDGVRDVLQLKRLLGASAVRKLPKMLLAIQNSPDDRARYSIQYYGGHTGRWAGRGFQPHNFPRESLKTPYFNEKRGVWDEKNCDPAEAVEWFYKGASFVEMRFQEDLLLSAGKVLRHGMMAGPGNTFLVGDYAGVEMRVDLALAGEAQLCEWIATGVDVYSEMAVQIYNLQLRPGAPMGVLRDKDWYAEWYGVTGAQRTIGKNTVLGCGFQMGAKTFWERYCQGQPFEFAEKVVKVYRTGFAPAVEQLWWRLNHQAKFVLLQLEHHRETARGLGATNRDIQRTLDAGYKPSSAPKYDWHNQWVNNRFELVGDWLTYLLPSGRKLFYYKPRMAIKPWPDGSYDLSVDYQGFSKGRVVYEHTYGGKLCENVVQALARDLLVHSMFKLEENGFPVVLTVHDEIVCEVPAATADVKAFKEIMEIRPQWAVDMGVPISIEEWVGDRYRK